MKIIMDACSIILLAKASVLETAAKKHSIEITRSVYDEVIAGKKKVAPDALLLERLCKERLITINKENKDKAKKIMNDFNMGKGEAATIASGMGNDFIIATDNRQGRKAAEIHGIPLVGSIEIIVTLHRKKLISYEKAKVAIKTLEKEGWMHSSLIEKALEDVRNDRS
jgi:predicted nucleic acid-binding protein